jgi:hypothetical protein
LEVFTAFISKAISNPRKETVGDQGTRQSRHRICRARGEVGQDRARVREPVEEGVTQLGREGKDSKIKAKQSVLIRASGGLAGESADIQKCGWMDEEDRERKYTGIK